MNRSLVIAAALAFARSQQVLPREAEYKPTDYPPPRHASHDAERIAKAEAKRARKAAKRARAPEAKP